MAFKNKESFAIKLSVYGSVVMALTGILSSILGNSITLLFDALYTLIAMMISLAGLRISKLLNVKYSARFNFGYHSFEALFVFINGILLMILAVSLFISSIQSILDGGRAIELEVVIVYLVFSFIVCGTLTVILKYYAKKTKSEILQTESLNWLLDTLISLVVLGVFFTSIYLEKSNYKYLIPYLDPAVTILLILCFVYQPIKLIKSGLFDLLRAAPPKKLIAEIRERLLSHKDTYRFTDIEICAAKVGRTSLVEISCIYPKDFEIKTLETIETLRNQIKTEVESYSHHLEVKVWIRLMQE